MRHHGHRCNQLSRQPSLRDTRIARLSFTRRKQFLTLVLLAATMISLPTPEWLARLIPRTQRELRRKMVDWHMLLERARQESKFTLDDGEFFDLYVISLKRTEGRKNKTVNALKRQHIRFTIFEAVDGLGDLDDVLVQKYAGSKKMHRLLATSHMSLHERLELYKKYDMHALRCESLRVLLHERLRFGVYLSHVQLWEEMLELGLPFIVVLEDDVDLRRNFRQSFTSLLKQLPKTWDLLYLNGSYKKYGLKYSEGLVQSRGGVGAFGYAISKKAASYYLQHAALRSDRALDLMMNEEVVAGRVLAFHAVPHLVDIIDGVKTSLAY